MLRCADLTAICVLHVRAVLQQLVACSITHLTGEDIQSCLLGVCLLMTNVPYLPNLTVKTPCCRNTDIQSIG